MLPFLIAATLSAQIAPAPLLVRPGLLRVRISSALGRSEIEVEIGVLQRQRSTRHYWFRRASARDGFGPPEYATTAECPIAHDRLESLEQIPMPVPDLPGFGRESTQIILDGAQYVLETPALHQDGQSGDLKLTSNVGSPLARWIDALIAALEPCWRPVRPPGLIP
ncbi:MAG: hypothetical protein QOJ53_212 [Sphingomonadales bacterium]|jgi:hypothetical protein|nr:hypothetical protein [Sphingomonadales bacterium]